MPDGLFTVGREWNADNVQLPLMCSLNGSTSTQIRSEAVLDAVKLFVEEEVSNAESSLVFFKGAASEDAIKALKGDYKSFATSFSSKPRQLRIRSISSSGLIRDSIIKVDPSDFTEAMEPTKIVFLRSMLDRLTTAGTKGVHIVHLSKAASVNSFQPLKEDRTLQKAASSSPFKLLRSRLNKVSSIKDLSASEAKDWYEKWLRYDNMQPRHSEPEMETLVRLHHPSVNLHHLKTNLMPDVFKPPSSEFISPIWFRHLQDISNIVERCDTLDTSRLHPDWVMSLPKPGDPDFLSCSFRAYTASERGITTPKILTRSIETGNSSKEVEATEISNHSNGSRLKVLAERRMQETGDGSFVLPDHAKIRPSKTYVGLGTRPSKYYASIVERPQPPALPSSEYPNPPLGPSIASRPPMDTPKRVGGQAQNLTPSIRSGTAGLGRPGTTSESNKSKVENAENATRSPQTSSKFTTPLSKAWTKTLPARKRNWEEIMEFIPSGGAQLNPNARSFTSAAYWANQNRSHQADFPQSQSDIDWEYDQHPNQAASRHSFGYPEYRPDHSRYQQPFTADNRQLAPGTSEGFPRPSTLIGSSGSETRPAFIIHEPRQVIIVADPSMLGSLLSMNQSTSLLQSQPYINQPQAPPLHLNHMAHQLPYDDIPNDVSVTPTQWIGSAREPIDPPYWDSSTDAQWYQQASASNEYQYPVMVNGGETSVEADGYGVERYERNGTTYFSPLNTTLGGLQQYHPYESSHQWR